MLYALKENKRICSYGGEELLLDRIILSGARGEKLFCLFALKPDKDLVVTDAFIDSEENSIKDNAEIFWVEPVKVKNKSCSYGVGSEVPEIMIPLAHLKSGKVSGEVKNGYNQVFVLEFTLPRDIKSDKFNLSFFVTAGEIYQVLVEVKVFDFSLPKENHSKQAFAIWYENQKVIDNTPSAYPRGEKYQDYLKSFNLLKKYKICATELPVKSARYPEYSAACDTNVRPFEARRGIMPNDIDNFISSAIEATNDPEIASYSIPYDVTHVDGMVRVDKEQLERVLLAMVNSSTKEVDLLLKAYLYVTFIDEPTAAMFNTVRTVKMDVIEVLDRVSKSCDFSGKENVRVSLLSIDNVVPSWPEENLLGGVDTWCPTFSGWYAPEFEEGMNAILGLGDKTWWYGCIAPWYPFPSYHLDEPLLGARAEGFLRYLFKIKGNLYWAVNADRHNDDINHRVVVDDVYNGEWFFGNSNGEGVLLFSGDKYSIEGPLASLRTLAICEGNQDYEYCYLLSKKLKELSDRFNEQIDFNDYVKHTFSRAFFRTAIVDEDAFSEARQEIADCIVAANLGVLVYASEIDLNNSVVTVTAVCEKDREISCPYTPIEVKTKGNKTTYKFYVKLKENVDNYICLKVNYQGKEISVKRYLGRSAKVISLDQIKLSKNIEEKVLGRIKRYEIERFVNDNCPVLRIDGDFDFSRLDDIYLKINSFTRKDFMFSVVIEDQSGRKFNVNYGVVKYGENYLRLHFNKVIPLNGFKIDKRTTSCSHYTEELKELNKIDLKKIKSVIFEVHNLKEFCAMAQRQMNFDGVEFELSSAHYTEWIKDPHDYDFIKGVKND